MARRFKLATTFNLLGLIVAFAAFYLMMTQIIYQQTYNHGIEDNERLYRVDTDYLNNHGLFSDEIFYPIVDVLNSMPNKESYSLMYHNNYDPVFASFYEVDFQTKDKEIKSYPSEGYCNETAVSTLISKNKVLNGDIDWTDTTKNPYRGKRGVIIPKSIAMDYFGKVNVAGDSMMRCYPDTALVLAWTIRGVYEDFPENCEFQNCIYEIAHEADLADYKHSFAPSFKCYIKFKQVPKDVEALNDSLKQAILDKIDKEGWEKYAEEAEMSESSLRQSINDMHIRLTPLKDSYFVSKSLSSGDHGFKPMLIILAAACLLLIIIAAIHFLNFALVESPMRIRGVNTRLVLGASRRSLQRGIVSECVITSVIAAIIALIVCGALSQWFTTKQLIDGHFSTLSALVVIAFAVLVGFVAGLYPAAFVTSFSPAMALKGDFGLSPQGHKLRKAIIGCQLFISFLMVIYLGILIREEYYIFNSEYRYNKDQVFMTTVPTTANDSVKRELYKELTAITGVNNVSFSDGSMGLSDFNGSQLSEVNDNSINYNYTYVDTAYLHTFGIEISEGRNFLPSDTHVAIINKSAQEKWKWMKVDSKIQGVSDYDSLTIVGICDDIRYNTTRIDNNLPFAFIIEPETYRYYLNLNVDNNASRQTIDLANAILEKHFKKNAKALKPFDKKLEETYEDELRYFKWILFLSIVCTVITLIGVFCLTMFESEYRRKEIGIRKIAGASTGEVVKMLCLQYIPLILISFAVAVPIAWKCGKVTLKYFYDHTVIPWWIYPLALLIVGGIVMITILLQSWRTARENPVNSLKSE